MLDEYDLVGQIFTAVVSLFGIVANSVLIYAIRTKWVKFSTHTNN